MPYMSLFDQGNVSQIPFQKWEKVFDQVEGVYVAKKIIPNRLPGKEGTNQTVYTLVRPDGQPIYVAGRSGEPQVIPGLEIRKFGDYVGIRYEKDIPPKQKGFNPTKAINVYFAGERKLDVLQEFLGAGSVFPTEEAVETDEAEIPAM